MKERILMLKEKRTCIGLSVREIYCLANKNSDVEEVSISTISRIFQNGSEDKGFRISSIKAIEDALASLDTTESDRIHLIEGKYQTEINHRNNAIEALKERNNEIKDMFNDKIDKEREAFNTRISQLNDHMKFLADQINVKDKRMDEKDQRYDKLFSMFETLTEKYEQLQEQFLNRCTSCPTKANK